MARFTAPGQGKPFQEQTKKIIESKQSSTLADKQRALIKKSGKSSGGSGGVSHVSQPPLLHPQPQPTVAEKQREMISKIHEPIVKKPEPEEKKYIYTNPSGAVLTFDNKPEKWNTFVGKKQVVTLKGDTAVYEDENERTTINFSPGVTEKAKLGYLILEGKGQTERADKFFQAHAVKARPIQEQPQENKFTGRATQLQIGYIKKEAERLGGKIQIGKITPTGNVSYNITFPEGKFAGAENLTLSVPSDIEIMKQTMAKARKESAKRIYETADIPTKLALGATAAIGPESDLFWGAMQGEPVGKIEPIFKGTKEFDLAVKLPKTEKSFVTIEEAIKKSIETEMMFLEEESKFKGKMIDIPSVGKIEPIFKGTPKPGKMDEAYFKGTTRKTEEIVTSLPGQVALAYVGGGVAANVLSKSAIAASKGGQLAIAGVGTLFATPPVLDIAFEPDPTKQRGKVLKFTTSIVSGGVGFARASKAISKPKILDVDKIEGFSITDIEPATGKSIMKGQVTIKTKEGDITGFLKGTGKALDDVNVANVEFHIPKQKLGKFTVEKQRILSMGRGKGTTAKGGTKTVFGESSEGVIDANIPGFESRTLAGKTRSSVNLVQVKETPVFIDIEVAPGTRAIKKLPDTTYKKYYGTTTRTTGDVLSGDLVKDIKIASTGKGGKILDVPRSDVKFDSAVSVKWEDISVIRASKAAGVDKIIPTGKTTTPKGTGKQITEIKTQTTSIPHIPQVPTIKATPDVITRVVSPSIITVATAPSVLKSVEKTQIILDPKIKSKTGQTQRTRQVTATKQSIDSAMRMATETKIITPSVSKTKQLIDYVEVIDTSVKIAQITESKLTKITKLVTKEVTPIDSVHIPIIPIITYPPPRGVGFPMPGMGLDSGFGKAGKKRYKTRFKYNPVPKKLIVKVPKLNLPKGL